MFNLCVQLFVNEVEMGILTTSRLRVCYEKF